MDLDFLRNYCLDKKEVTDGFPFDDIALVSKVGSKLFSIIDIESKPLKISLKCDPFIAQDLRDKYPCVTPGYHLSKRHWNTIELDGSVPDEEILAMIDDSYALVFKGLKKSEREEIEKM